MVNTKAVEIAAQGTKLQAAHRGKLARKIAAVMKAEGQAQSEAASKLQAAYRGNLARKGVAAMKEGTAARALEPGRREEALHKVT